MDNKKSAHKRTQIMTVQDCAHYLGVHSITIYRLLKETDIPSFKLGGQWRFKKDILDNWLGRQMAKKRLSHTRSIRSRLHATV